MKTRMKIRYAIFLSKIRWITHLIFLRWRKQRETIIGETLGIVEQKAQDNLFVTCEKEVVLMLNIVVTRWVLIWEKILNREDIKEKSLSLVK